jgi:hypothetical protein
MMDDFPPEPAPAGQPIPGQRPITHLLVVAGLKGAGKSTLIRALRRRALPPEIASLLPQESANWPEIPAGTSHRWLPAMVRRAEPAILHYDLYLFAKTGTEFPAAQSLSFARQLTVIDILPTVDRLAMQFGAREGRVMLDGMIGYDPRATDGVTRRASQTIAMVGARRSEVLDRYATAGWVEEVYKSWKTFVRAAAAGADLFVIEIEPETAMGGAGWRLKRKDSRLASG